MKVDDILEELMIAKETHIWPKLGATDWATYVMKLIGGTREANMDKPIINNLVETNAYVTKRVIELEGENMDITPETIQPKRTDQKKKTAPMQTQMSWAQVAANAHQRSPAQPKHTTSKTPQMKNPEKTADLQCLIIQVSPPIPATERPNGIDTRNQINDMLDQKQTPQYFWVMAVGYSVAGNIKISTTHTCKAADLMAFREEIAVIITKNRKSTRLNSSHQIISYAVFCLKKKKNIR